MAGSFSGISLKHAQSAWNWFCQLDRNKQHFAFAAPGCKPLCLTSDGSESLFPSTPGLGDCLTALIGESDSLVAPTPANWKNCNFPFETPAFLLAGKISQEVVEALVTGDQKPGENPLRRNLLNVAVELIQNVVHHGSPKGEAHSSGIFVINMEEDTFLLCSGNQILDAEQADLEARLQRLADLSSDDLEDLYDEVLLSDEDEEGGAGLGLIDMRMRSGLPFVWSFDRLEDEALFFSIGVIIKRMPQ